MASLLETNRLYSKAYLLEFYDENNALKASFGFSVPPENEEFSFPFLKSETRTFGGLHVDEYGAGAATVAIQGSTGNRQKKLCFLNSVAERKTGEEEIFALKKIFDEQKTRKSLIAGVFCILTNLLTGEYWRFYPAELKINRDFSMPFTYKYALSGTIAPFVKNKEGAIWGGFAEFKKNLSKSEKGFFNNENAVLKALNSASAKVRSVAKMIGDFNDICDFMLSSLDVYVAALNGVVDAAGMVVDEVSETLNVANKTAQKIIGITNQFEASARSLVLKTREMSQVLTGFGQKEYWADIGVLFADNFGEDSAAYANWAADGENTLWECWTWKEMKKKEDAALSMNAAMSKSDSPKLVEADVPVGANLAKLNANIVGGVSASGDEGGGATAILRTFGNRVVSVKSSDTAEKMAQKWFGDADLAGFLLSYNGLKEMPSAGAVLKIPMTENRRTVAANEIYCESEIRDNYGKDVKLDENGGVVLDGRGDMAVEGGASNLAKAVLLRLRDSPMKRIRLNAYGIKSAAGGVASLGNYIAAQVSQTLSNEPRIEKIDRLSYEGSGDALFVQVDYTDINGEAQTFQGVM